VREAFQEMWGGGDIIGVQVESDVSDQPFNEEVLKGAVKRAEKALKLTGAEFGVGIEGGVIQLGEKWYNLGFVTIIDKNGRRGTGTSGWFECPPKILEQLKRGRELGDVMDDLTGRKDTKKQNGAVGIFTKGTVRRKDLYKHGIFMALIPFLASGVFQDDR
jgi:inosine/xanthosine triphosphatase